MRLIKFSDNGNPELVICEFGGILAYEDISDENIIEKEAYDVFELTLEHQGVLYMTAEEFKKLGGETVHVPDTEYEEEGLQGKDLIYFELRACFIEYFMTKENEIVMRKYLLN